MQFSKRIIYIPNAISSRSQWIEGEEHLHLSKVLRVKEKDKIRISNGRGQIFNGSIVELKPRKSLIQIDNAELTQANPPPLSIAVALLKGKDLEEVIETCAQLPIKSLIPLITERTQGADNREWEKLSKRLQAKSVVCTKQAIKPWNTEIKEPVTLEDYLKSETALKLLMEPTLETQQVNWSGLQESHLMCGPEGGWSESELALAKEVKSLHSFQLGHSILRAKNAPFFALGKLAGLAPHLF